MRTKKAFVSWSGGKDSALAFNRAKGLGFEICYLVNMLREDGTFSRSHGLSAEMLKAQALALGLPINQKGSSWGSYEEAFKSVISPLTAEGITAGVFGDIDVAEHKAWVERVCQEVGVEPILPLWGEDRLKLVDEFLSLGFKAVVCAINRKHLTEDFLGRNLDAEFFAELRRMQGVDLFGERGEYHTFVYDGPILRHPVKFIMGDILIQNDKAYVEIKPR